MTGMEDFIIKFGVLMDKSRSRKQYVYLRSIIRSQTEANNFVELFSEKTNTVWMPQNGKQYSDRFVFYNTWFCNRSWRKRGTSQIDDCNAKIDIYVRKDDPSSARYDEYLHYDPPLSCVIEITGQHSHVLEHPEDIAIKGVNEQVKKEFFNFFEKGHSPSLAKYKYSMQYRNKNCSDTKHTPTVRQAQILYNQWKGVKESLSTTSNEANQIQSKPVTFKEFLDALPKREILYSVKHMQSERDFPMRSNPNAKNKDIQFPLVFKSFGSIAAVPKNTAPLLYKLKHGIGGELVTDLVKPRIYSITIDLAAHVVVKNQLAQPLEDSSPSEPSEILGIPMSSDKSCFSTESSSKEKLDIPVKMEPLDNGYECEAGESSSKKVEDSSLPVITQAFSCGDACEHETELKPNVCCVKAGNLFFPLVFTLKGSICDTAYNKILVYNLKQGSSGVQVTEAVIPEISSVQINSLHEAAFQFKDASMLKAEGPLSITVQTEPVEENSSMVFSNGNLNEKLHEKDIMPIIVNASSCSDIFPVIADSVIKWTKQPRENLVVSPVIGPRNLTVNNPVHLPSKNQSIVETKQVTVTEVDKNDEDYLFLMSLLPELKRISPGEKNSVKRKIRDAFVTSRLTTNQIQFKNKRTNIYRDCGVLPISGGWKF